MGNKLTLKADKIAAKYNDKVAAKKAKESRKNWKNLRDCK
jgi:hypothetical protein